MSHDGASNCLSNLRDCEQVAEWKADVKHFFADDWSRLRTLIMDLEEESWTDDSASELGRVISRDHIRPVRETEDRHSLKEDEPRPAANRLSDLAAQIERRLRNTSGSER